MAFIVLTDGRKLYANHARAAKVYQVLLGNEEPENDEQSAFMETVATVEFDPLPHNNPHVRRVQKPHDAELDKILADPTLRGKDKARAIAERMKEYHK